MSTASIKKLLSIGSCGLDEREVFADFANLESHGRLAEELLQMLTIKNGFVAFENALYVFPASPAAHNMTLNHWNAPSLWRFEYEGLADGKLFFAMDAFGDQFCIFENHICSFEAETGKITVIADSLDGWAERILSDYNVLTGYSSMHEWQKANGRIPMDHRLMPKTPFVFGGRYELDNLYSIEAVKAMRFKGFIARQIKDIPDGTTIILKTID